jgi:D-alanyl-lipoteichoic acid acyltransferase DltB (MBOAT superfamily)
VLFNSVEFILIFLPVVITAAWLAERSQGGFELRNNVLLFASLGFYGYWDIWFLPLLVGSIACNYGASILIERGRHATSITIITIAANLICLGFFKYLLFFSEIFAGTDNYPEWVRNVVLPIGISFFTFQQIAYVVDVHRGGISVGRFLNYALFVSYFPQLIAGPILRYQQLVPQFQSITVKVGPLFSAGIFLFSVGLLKKVMLADNLAITADDIFARSEAGYELGVFDSWLGALSYTYQLYFDFSGYSDMALGLGLIFGFRLPMNFDSPYKATSIIEFWHRWHITLSNFFRDYVYIPLGGNRHGLVRQLGILLFVMALVGLWHGADWTFVIFGVYHGLLLAAAHLLQLLSRYFQAISQYFSRSRILDGDRIATIVKIVAWAVTFVLVMIGWVIFRAETWDGAMRIFKGLLSLGINSKTLLYDARYLAASCLIIVSSLICLAMPNACRMASLTVEGGSLLWRERKTVTSPQLQSWLQPAEGMSYRLIVLIAITLYLSVSTLHLVSSEFLYFQF